MLRRICWAVGGMLLVLAALEGLFRLLPTSTATRTGYYVDPDIWAYPPGHTFRTSFGWDLERAQRHRANNFGFIADRDFVPDGHAIALIGDSYVEASMLEPSQRIAAQIERHLQGTPVYAMGGPGSSLLDYVERVRFATDRFGTKTFVIVVERGDVLQTLCDSGNVHAQCLDPATLAPRTQHIASDQRPLTNLLRESAIAQYVFSQLRFNPANLVTRATVGFQVRTAIPAPTPPDPEKLERTIDTVVRTFLARLGPYRSARFVLILGCNMNSLRTQPAPPPDLAMIRLADAARGWGATVVNTEPLFRAHLEQGGLSLAVSPRDAHWNGLAIGIVALAAAEALRPDSGHRSSR